MAPPKEAPTATAEKKLYQFGDWFQALNRRLDFLTNLEAEMSEAFGGRRLRIMNEHLYWLVVSAYRMLLIDAASFGKEITDDGGLLRWFAANTNLFWVPKKPSGKPTDLFYDVNVQTVRYKQRSLKRMFPKMKTKVIPSDLETLIDEIRTWNKPIIDARDELHAHAYQAAKAKPGTLPLPVSLAKLRKLFGRYRILIRDLHLLVRDVGFAFETSLSSKVAKDLRDVIVHGTIQHWLLELYDAEVFRDNGHYWDLSEKYYSSQKWTKRRAKLRARETTG